MTDSEQSAGSDLDFDREIRVRLAFAAVAAVLGIGVAVVTDVPEWVAFGVVIVLGILAPRDSTCTSSSYLYVD